jgi:hypothetical protein
MAVIYRPAFEKVRRGVTGQRPARGNAEKACYSRSAPQVS